MIPRCRIFAFVLFMLCGLLHANNSVLHIKPNWVQGEIGLIVLYPTDKLPKVKAQIIDPNGRIRATVPMFPYRFSKQEGGHVVAIGMFGLSPEMPAGLYSVLVKSDKSNDYRSWEASVFVSKKNYKKRTIRMGKMGTSIQSARVTQERQAQAKRFYEALAIYRPNSIYHTGSLIWPIRGEWRQSSGYGETRTFIYSNGRTGRDFHDATDLAGRPIGTPIYAPADGRIVLAEFRIVTGYTIIIEHLPGVFTLYYHLNGLRSKKGQKVRTGDHIGYLGTTGFSTGPHLHFGVRVNGWSIDPYYVISNPFLDKEWILSRIRNSKRIESQKQNMTRSKKNF
ncbi:MAG: M23 family metallopeptidase [Spirochaetia bacterium]